MSQGTLKDDGDYSDDGVADALKRRREKLASTRLGLPAENDPEDGDGVDQYGG